MKLKYSASLALALWLCVVAWVSALIVAKPSVERAYANGDGSAAIAQLQLNIRHNRQMLSALDELRAIEDDGRRGLAVTPAPLDQAGQEVAGELPGVSLSGHRLSMILSTENGRRAVIDGQLARPGTRLADGSRVRGIGVDHVRLEDRAGQPLVLRMPAPFTATATAGAGMESVR